VKSTINWVNKINSKEQTMLYCECFNKKCVYLPSQQQSLEYFYFTTAQSNQLSRLFLSEFCPEFFISSKSWLKN